MEIPTLTIMSLNVVYVNTKAKAWSSKMMAWPDAGKMKAIDRFDNEDAPVMSNR